MFIMSYINHRGGWPDLAPESESNSDTPESANVMARGLKQIGSFLGRLTLDSREVELHDARQKFYDDIAYFGEHGVFPDEVSSEAGDMSQRSDAEQ